MFNLFVLALLSQADSLNSPSIRRDAPAPIATCVRPAVMVIEPNTVCALPTLPKTDPQVVASCLRRWEQATKNSPEWSRSQREEFRRRLHEDFNEHTVAAVEQFVGQIKMRTLTAGFDWQIVEQSSDLICLEAIPRDETERLFYGALRVTLDAETGNLEQLGVVNRQRSHRIAWQSEHPLQFEQIRLVHFEDGVPPAPRALVRTANLSID